MFSKLFKALKLEGILSSSEFVYFPAANKQLETRIFSSLGKDDKSLRFIGGDLNSNLVRKGKRQMPEGAANAQFVVADAFYAPFKEVGAIIDIQGAAGYSFFKLTEAESEPDSGNDDGKKISDFKSILFEYHRILKPNGVLVLDDTGGIIPHKYPSTMRLIEVLAPEVFEGVKRGEFDFQTEEGYKVAFRARPLRAENGKNLAYVFEKV